MQAGADARDESLGIGSAIARSSRRQFIAAYTAECLNGFDAAGVLPRLGSDGPICLFCVEREPPPATARSSPTRLARHGATVRDLLP